MKAKFGSVEVEGSVMEIAALINSLQSGTNSDESQIETHGNTKKFVSAELAFKVLKRRTLSPHQTMVLQILLVNHPNWTTAHQLQKAIGYNGNQLGGLFGAFGKRIVGTEGYRDGLHFFDYEWNLGEDCYQYRLPESVHSAVLRARI